MLIGASKQLKQIIEIEHNIVKNPSWSGANQLAFHKRGRGFGLGASEKQIKVMVRDGQSWTRTRDRRIATPRRWPLGHAVSS